MCTTHSDCEMFATGGKCVLWDRDFGCGMQRQTCCPGQNCGLDNGVPSCLGNGCTLVGGAVDAGTAPADSGAVPPLPTAAP